MIDFKPNAQSTRAYINKEQAKEANKKTFKFLLKLVKKEALK